MELPKIMKSERGGMLDGIKSKLGFADARAERDDYGEYGDDYGDYGPEFDDDGASASRYDPYAPVTTRPARRGAASGPRASSSEFPKLVSIDDVRANTQVPDSLRRDPLPPRRVTGTSSSLRGERTVIDTMSPAPSSPAHTAARRERSEGLNSLFEPSATDGAPSSGGRADAGFGDFALPTATPAPKSAATAASAAAASAFDPYEAYAGSGSAAHSPSRSLSVLKPASYGEVEHVAKILKAGDAAVLSLRNTPDQLSKRILDFSFGVSSALDASVECIADKVFAITRGAALSDAERQALRNQGVL
ncbi:MAG: cell division protein SepF [Gordonibacter sp.]|uniref:cell division protein SepF n=1 Tax=Gordonibacter sp. TaxID=1968902 RepID=UPI002FC89913